MYTRRDFLGTLTAAAAAYGVPPIDLDDWTAVRRQFLIPPDRIYLNVGTLGVQPRLVVDAVIDATTRTAESFPPGFKWDALRQAVGSLLDCDAAGLVFPRNTTEAMNFIANGLEWSAGDHIVTTNHEHVGGLCCWQLIAARYGVLLTQADIGTAPADASAVFDSLTAAVTSKTKLMSVSHVNFTTGFIMPVRALAKWCRQRGIIFVVDGAHPPGMMRTSIRDIDPDFYASSPHKWLLAPQGTGLLYLREQWRTKLWPTLASGGWDDMKLGAHRFNHMGTLDESRLVGLLAALEFHNAVGPDRVYGRISDLRRQLMYRLSEIPGVRMVSTIDGAGLVSFVVDGLDSLELQKTLGAKNVRTRVIGEYKYGYMRLSPHVYTSREEIDRVVGWIAGS